MKRTNLLEPDATFNVATEITKAYQDGDRRILRGVASGIAEDRDGERVSSRAIRKMVAQVAGQSIPLVTGLHQEDWDTEIGEVSVRHDPEHDELFVEAELPPEGQDPLADKAWTNVTRRGQKLGFSIGGKLRKAYYELGDTGKRRKVLDDISLRHVALTKKPSYTGSFAEAIAKTFTDDVDDGDFLDADDEPLIEVAKAAATATVDNDLVAAIQAAGQLLTKAAANRSAADQADTGPTGDARRGTKTADRPATDVNGDDTDDKDDKDETDKDTDADAAASLPKGEGARHLACPNCGHEFAADLPAELSEDGNTSPDEDRDNTDRDAATRKSSAQETDMAKTLDEALDEVRRLASGAPADTTPEESVEKTDTTTDTDTEPAATADAPDVLKMVAASHRHSDERIDGLHAKTEAGFEIVAKAITGLTSAIGDLPRGRKSIVRSDEGVAKRFTDDPDGDGEKTVEKRMEDAEGPFEALKVLNEATYGIK